MQCGKANSFWIVLIEIFVSLNSVRGKVAASFLILLAESLACVISCNAYFFYVAQNYGKKFILGLQLSCGCIALLSSLGWYRLIFIGSYEIRACCFSCGI